MATNTKHTSSAKYQKALTLEDRVSIDKIITTHRNPDGSMNILLNDIGRMLEKDPTTISKEVKSRRTPINMATPSYPYAKQYCQCCTKTSKCEHKKDMTSIPGVCPNFEKHICQHLRHFPWVCNGCNKRQCCKWPKSFYNPISSEEAYKYTLEDSRKGIYMSLDEFKEINEIVSAGLKKKQSIEHIIHSNDIPVCTKTLYNYLHQGLFNADVTDTHRMRLFIKESKTHKQNSKILRRAKLGKHYEDFIKLLEQNPSMNYVEMDTVEGTKGGKACLSLKLVKIQLQFYFLLEEKTAHCVVTKLNEIQSIIGIEAYKSIFGIILTDNGSEFTDIDGIMYDSETGELRTQLFFCHPQCSGEKGSCEKNHELFRYIYPKGTTFNYSTQQDFNKATSHVNSLKRKSTDYSTPIELFYAYFGREILDKLNISLIDPNEVVLSPELLKK